MLPSVLLMLLMLARVVFGLVTGEDLLAGGDNDCLEPPGSTILEPSFFPSSNGGRALLFSLLL